MTGSLQLTPASELGMSDLAELFTRAYEGYEVPMHVDAGALAFMQEAFDLEPERSRVAWQDGRAVGVGMLGVRGERAWVGGMGAASEAGVTDGVHPVRRGRGEAGRRRARGGRRRPGCPGG